MGTCDLDDVGNPAIDQDPNRGGGGEEILLVATCMLQKPGYEAQTLTYLINALVRDLEIFVCSTTGITKY